MKRLLSLLKFPLLLETLNILVHQIFRTPSAEWHWLDVATTAVTLFVMAWIGWILGRERGSYTQAMTAAIILWLVVVAFVALTGEVGFRSGERSYDSQSHYIALQGFVIASALAVPIVAIAALFGAMASRRLRRSGSI